MYPTIGPHPRNDLETHPFESQGRGTVLQSMPSVKCLFLSITKKRSNGCSGNHGRPSTILCVFACSPLVLSVAVLVAFLFLLFEMPTFPLVATHARIKRQVYGIKSRIPTPANRTYPISKVIPPDQRQHR